jgi:hypothetical protein
MEYLQLLKDLYENRSKYALAGEVAELQVEICNQMNKDA